MTPDYRETAATAPPAMRSTATAVTAALEATPVRRASAAWTGPRHDPSLRGRQEPARRTRQQRPLTPSARTATQRETVSVAAATEVPAGARYRRKTAVNVAVTAVMGARAA